MRCSRTQGTGGGAELAGKHDPTRHPDETSGPGLLRTGPIMVKGLGKGLRRTLGTDPARRHVAARAAAVPQPVPMRMVDEGPEGTDRWFKDSAPEPRAVESVPDTSGDAAADPPRTPSARSARERLLGWVGSLRVQEQGAARWLGLTAVAVLVVATVILISAVVQQNRTLSTRAVEEAGRYTPPPLPTVVPLRGELALIGDELSAPAASAKAARQGWQTAVANSTGLAFTSVAADGTGYLVGGTQKQTFVAQARRVPTDADFVVLFGGVHDAGRSQVALARAATEAIAVVHERVPKARILLIGPPSAGVETADAARNVRRALRAAAELGGAVWVDPATKGWALENGVIAGSVLSAAQNRRIAAGVAAALKPLVD